MASLPKEEVEIEVPQSRGPPQPRGPRVTPAAKKKVNTVGPVANSRIKTVNNSAAVPPVAPPPAPTTIPGSTATTTVPLTHAQHNSVAPHQVI